MLDTVTQYDEVAREAREVMLAKNADYGDSWRIMRLSGIVDQIHVKVHRIIQLEALQAKGESPKVSEGIESELRDIANYAIFATIKLREK